jgi:hypothetical protein
MSQSQQPDVSGHSEAASPGTLNGQPRRHAGYKVVAGLMLLATLMGTYAYSRFDASERHLMGQLEHFATLGVSANETQCIDAVLEWLPTCPAMLSLCRDSVGRMMGACLHGQDRADLCQSIEPIRRRTSFGYEECKARGLDRPGQKACAAAYRAIDKHCEDRSKE